MKMSPRMKCLRHRLFDQEYHDPGVWYFKDVNILDKWPHIVNEPMVVRKGYAQRFIGENLPAVIKPDELIVGNPNQNSVGWGTVLPIYYTEEEGLQASRYNLNEASVWGHHPPDWGKILKIGTIGVRAQIVEAMRIVEATGQIPALSSKSNTISIDKLIPGIDSRENALNEYKAMLIALDGLDAFACRHAKLALTMATECDDPVRKQELLDIYEVCNYIPKNPARSFHEAVQAYWFTYCMVNSGGEYVPLGRTDQYLYPYYEADIDAGIIDKEQAQDILASFLVKCNERVIQDTKLAENHYNYGLFSQGVRPSENGDDLSFNQTGGYAVRALTWQDHESDDSEANFNYGQSGNDWLMNCIVAGQHIDGSDATTDLSLMFVEIMAEMNLLMPTLAVRVHSKTPQAFLDKVAEVLRYGRGEPIVYNDDAIIPGFVELGIPIEVARDYSNDGCWETLIQGKSHFSYAHVMNPICIERVLASSELLEELTTFEDFYRAYTYEVNAYIDMQCQTRLDNYGLSYMIAPDPLMSSIMDDCVQKGRDISQDGARYIFHQILVTGLSTTADSLMAIKELVYEQKLMSLVDLKGILADNWNGYEDLRAIAQNKIAKFGNDEDEVDTLAIRLLDDFADYVSQWNEKTEGMYFVSGIGTFENYAALGRDISASADGRLSGEALAPNYSPSPGADKDGPTSVIKSITKPDLVKYYSGTPLDLSVNSGDVKGKAGITRLSGMIRSFCELGGQILTITSTNVVDLLDAKERPDAHRSLMVRMGGLSAYFIALSPVQQDNIIKRFSR